MRIEPVSSPPVTTSPPGQLRGRHAVHEIVAPGGG
jgi:hypothetical protein